jgi:hypothetical protein
MTLTNNLATQPVNQPLLRKCILIGGGIALAIIAFFVLGVRQPKPEWGALWMIRPLLVTPIVGAIGGACYYFANNLFILTGWKKVTIGILSVLGFIIALWMGVVLGLAGTMWN